MPQINLLPSILLTLALLGLPFLHWLERTQPELWNNRLIIPFITQEPHRHTPRFFAGTFLPPVINRDLTLTPDQSPVLLTKTTVIPSDVHLTITAGTLLFAHEFAELRVEGQLTIAGTADQPVELSTNELHPLNQTWNGITFLPNSQGTISHTTIRHATPSVSCLTPQSVILDSIKTDQTLLGVFTNSPACQVKNSRIKSTGNGIVSSGSNPSVINTVITAARENIKGF